MSPTIIIDITGKKSEVDKTQNQDKLRISELLTILADGTKLAMSLIKMHGQLLI